MDGLRLILLIVGLLLIAGIYFWETRGRWRGRWQRARSRAPAKARETEPTLPAAGARPRRRDAGAADGAPDPLVPDRLGPDALGPDALGPDALGPDALGPDALGPDALGPDALGPDALGEEPHARRTAGATSGGRSAAADPFDAFARIAAREDDEPHERFTGLEVIVPREARDAEAVGRTRADPSDELIVGLTVLGRNGRRYGGRELCAALETAGLRHGEMDIFHYHDEARAPVFSAANVLKPGTFDLAALDEVSSPGVALFMRLPGEMDGAQAFELMLETGQRIAAELDAELCDEGRSTLTRQAANHLRERILEFGRRERLRQH